jgi:hypothetical protein
VEQIWQIWDAVDKLEEIPVDFFYAAMTCPVKLSMVFPKAKSAGIPMDMLRLFASP